MRTCNHPCEICAKEPKEYSLDDTIIHFRKLQLQHHIDSFEYKNYGRFIDLINQYRLDKHA